MHSYAININLNRKCGKKKYVETQNFDFFFGKTKTVIFFFLSPMFYSPLVYLAGIMV